MQYPEIFTTLTTKGRSELALLADAYCALGCYYAGYIHPNYHQSMELIATTLGGESTEEFFDAIYTEIKDRN